MESALQTLVTASAGSNSEIVCGVRGGYVIPVRTMSADVRALPVNVRVASRVAPRKASTVSVAAGDAAVLVSMTA